MAASLMLTGGVMAQKEKKTKVAKSKTVTVAATPAVTTTSAVTEVPVVDNHAGHNHDQQKADAAKPAEALWVSETAHDFGKIPQGKPVTTEFELKNTGKDSLRLENVQASCGCTTPVWKAGNYAPGEKFKITVGYNAAAEGAFTKPVTITYNGQQKVVTITGTVYTTPSTPAPENKGVSKVQD
jgi:hypothetical protein